MHFVFVLQIGTLKTLLEAVQVGVSVKELCEKGDALLLEETGKVRLRIFCGYVETIIC